MTWTKHESDIAKLQRKFASWEHVSGWTVNHCGHPTANWPYFLQHPGRPEMVVAFNGLGFKTAEAARQVVEWIVAGEVIVTTHNCVDGIARVPNITAMGHRLPFSPLAEVSPWMNDPRELLGDIPGLSSWILYDPRYLDTEKFASALRQAWTETENPGEYWNWTAQEKRVHELYLAAGGRIEEPKPHSAGRHHKKKPQPEPPSAQAELFGFAQEGT